jgi:hypothetical protein
MTENLSDELRKKYGRNTGVVITTVLYNTPAFLSNFFEGDVIIAANGQDVSSVDGFWQVLNQYAGQDCAITVLRQNEKITIPVKFNAQGSSYSTNSPTQRNSNNEGIDKIEARGSDANKTRYTNTSPGIADEDDARERRLRNLIKMRDGKLITEEEYQQMRKKVLDEI